MSDSNNTYERHSSAQKSSGLTAIIAALSVVDIALIITAIVLLVNVLSGPAASTAEATPKTTSADTQTDSADTTQGSDDSGEIRDVTGAETFATPTGNIICTIASTGVTCSIAKLDSKPKEGAGTCEGFTGYVVELRSTGTTLPCVAKADLPGAAGSGTNVLNYDSEKTVNNFKCVSSRTGMKCEDTNTSRGFTLARAGIKTF